MTLGQSTGAHWTCQGGRRPPIRSLGNASRRRKYGVITDAANRETAEQGTRSIVLPSRIAELYTPIPYIIPAQIFAACLAGQKGLDPDRPRTLRKITKTL